MKNNIKYLLSCLLFLTSCFLEAQGTKKTESNPTIDSLLNALKAFSSPSAEIKLVKGSDTSKINTLNLLSKEYINIGNYEQALQYAKQAMQIAEKFDFKKGISGSYSNIGFVYWNQGDYPKALDYYFKALNIDEELGNKNGIARDFGNIALVYDTQSDYPKALYYYFKALKIGEELKDNYRIAIQLFNIGVVYAEQDDYPKALDYYSMALKRAKELGNKYGMSKCLGNIGLVHSHQGDSPKALNYYFKSLKMKEELGDKKGIANTLGNIGIVYEEQGDYPKALEYYFKALKIADDLGDKNGIAADLGNIGSLYTFLKKYNEAYNYTYRALALSESIGAKYYVQHRYETLSTLYEKANIPLPDSIGGKILNMEQMRLRSMYYFKRSIAIRDAIFSEENTKQLVRKEMNYEFDKKEAITKAENEKQKAVAEEKSRKQKIIIWSVACSLLLVFVFAGFIFRSFRVTSKQKKIIESQNFQIVESINYSKKIQDSLLPSIESMQKAIPDLFVFYEPKAIVSGDFYYFKEFEKYTLLACVDCTGHGVPGGFMSTLGNLLLDKIVDNEKLSPSEILNKLSNEIIRVLHQQDGGEIQDGMDLSICLIDRNNHKIEFSGARNGIIVVTNEQAKRYKADPLPVGGNYMKKGIAIERNFKTQHITINPNDWIYMYTDGFMEQVGGTEGVPMNYTQFENQLISVSKKQTQEEKNKLLKRALDNWRETHERDDDVLIMGFQIG